MRGGGCWVNEGCVCVAEKHALICIEDERNASMQVQFFRSKREYNAMKEGHIELEKVEYLNVSYIHRRYSYQHKFSA